MFLGQAVPRSHPASVPDSHFGAGSVHSTDSVSNQCDRPSQLLVLVRMLFLLRMLTLIIELCSYKTGGRL